MYKSKRKLFYNYFIKICGAFLVICICLGAVIYNQNDIRNAVFVSVKPYSETVIIIDAGHGGFDGGAVSNDGTVEKDINLLISDKLSKLLKLNGFNVIMSRTTDTGTDSTSSKDIAKRKKSDMVNRLKLIEDNPDSLYIGIHLNKFTTSAAAGAQVFYSGNNPLSYDLGNSIQQTVKDMLQPENDRVIKKGTKSTYLLYNSRVPSVIVECGFLSNTAELQKLKTDDYQTKIAICVCAGILNYFGGEYGSEN